MYRSDPRTYLVALCFPLLSSTSLAQPTMLDATVTQIEAGGNHACALTTSGGVKCWGWNGNGELGDGTATTRLRPVDVMGLATGVVKIAAGLNHTCALTNQGGIKCWGRNDRGQLGNGTTVSSLSPANVTGLTSGVVDITVGEVHTCAITSAGGVKCWGDNLLGQLGDGTTVGRATPADVLTLKSGAMAVSAGLQHTCALTQAGGLKCWGYNGWGGLGNGTTDDQAAATDVTGLSRGVIALSAGGYHTCALTSEGGVKCWGANAGGEVGDGTTTDRLVPIAVSDLAAGVESISAGEGHTCAITSGHAALCWGVNGEGRLGDGTEANRLTPTPVSGFARNAAAISAGGLHTCALTGQGGARCWGGNALGAVGDGTTTDRWVATAVSTLADGAKGISAGGADTCALSASGGASCWGSNGNGQLGDGTHNDRPTPTRVSTQSWEVASTDPGNTHTCALTDAGGVRCWGKNTSGELGDGTTTERAIPVDVVGLQSGVIAIAAGEAHTCALTQSGAVKCWGFNFQGQLGDGTTTERHTPVSVIGLETGVIAIATGAHHTCAVTSSGGAKCWGLAAQGQIGDGFTINRSVPVNVVGLTSGVTAISAGSYGACVLTTGGGVRCWGYNLSGQLGDGTTTSRLTSVSALGLTAGVAKVDAGLTHTCAVLQTGEAMCWGSNSRGQLGDGTTTDRLTATKVSNFPGVTSIKAAFSHTCALNDEGVIKCWGSNSTGQVGDGTTTSRSLPTPLLIGQSMTFVPPSWLPLGVSTPLVASSTSGLPVAFDTWTPSQCTISGNAVVAVAPGLCGIRASQGGNGGAAAAPQLLRVIQAAPLISVSDATVLEGSSGPTFAVFTVSLSGATTQPVTAMFATADMTASSPADYAAWSGPITFAPGEISKTVTVEIVGDSVAEPIEYMSVHLSAVNGAIAGRIAALGAIVDDDGSDPVSLSIADGRGPEGYLAGSILSFPVRLSRPAIAPVTVNYATAGGTATAGADFATTAGQLAFAVGDVEKSVIVPILGDAIPEPNETFTVILSSPTGASVAPGGEVATGTILNDDLSTISVTDFSVVEGNAGTPPKLAFTVILSATSTSAVTVSYATADGTATAGSDYVATSGTLSIPPGAASAVVQVPVTPDAVIEPNETVFLNLSNATGATIFDAQGVGTIVADDGLIVSIGDKTTVEGNTGLTPVTFTVSLSAPAPGTVTVDYATADGTAAAPLDYTAATGTVTFNTGEQTKTITIQVVGETEKEAYETFFVDLSNPTGGAN
ncbi:MAG: hypothetical protein K1Y01_08450, partial [Vicinamibacteria bacterium]|nr:hypothetical protein [Vicinamibacteria bacterium]